jgi:hypothetical protein
MGLLTPQEQPVKRLRLILPLTAALLALTASVASAHNDVTHLPLGDAKYSTTSASVGSIYLCQNSVRSQAATISAPWMNGDGTYDPSKLVKVDGAVSWEHQYSVTVQGGSRLILGNDLPNHTTGTFPINRADDAYSYDRNPNSISAQTIDGTLPVNPTYRAQPNCLSGGAIGVMKSGVVIFNGLDSEGRDAVANEITDECGGHPQQQGWYHYHNLSPCLGDSATGGHSGLIGYALDGFGIYGVYGEDGAQLWTADLDECHGHSHLIEWEGEWKEMFHYHATADYPYTLSCYRGQAIRLESNTGGGSTQQCTTPSTQPQQGAMPSGQGTQRAQTTSRQQQGGQGQGGQQTGGAGNGCSSQQQGAGGSQQQGQQQGGQGQQGVMPGGSGQGQSGQQGQPGGGQGSPPMGGQQQGGGQSQQGGPPSGGGQRGQPPQR